MDYKVLYRKYRPDNFSNIIGQDYMVSILKNSIQKDHISHAYIFSGPRGTGKTSTAKVFAKAINCMHPTEKGPCNECESCIHFKENADIIEIDAASNNGVDEIREIINNIKLAPAYSKYKVYIIDEVHMLSTSAFNALLLTLEEPPKHVVFILATTNIEAVPITILSRCQRFDFHKISTIDIIKRLNYVVEQEKIDIDKDALEEIAYISDGGMRDALSILDQLSGNTTKVTLEDVMSHFGSVSKKQINDLFEYIVNGEIDKFITTINKFKELAIDYKLLIKKMLEKIEAEAIAEVKDINYKGLLYKDLKEMAFSLSSISNYININIDPYLLIEITLLKYFQKEENSMINTAKESKIISREIISQPKSTIFQDKTNELKRIRVNNCFVNAKKEYLQKIRDTWDSFLETLEDKTLLNLLIDSNLVVASDKLAIISSSLEGTVALINNNLDKLKKYYDIYSNTNYNFIAISDSEWQKEKQIYITNLKNNYKYEYIEEPVEKQEEPKESTSMEDIALNLFDKDKIEIN